MRTFSSARLMMWTVQSKLYSIVYAIHTSYFKTFQKLKKTNVSARRISDKRGGAAKTMCNTLAPFSKATFPSFIACLYLLDSRDRV